jgi:hypothetical protein
MVQARGKTLCTAEDRTVGRLRERFGEPLVTELQPVFTRLWERRPQGLSEICGQSV